MLKHEQVCTPGTARAERNGIAASGYREVGSAAGGVAAPAGAAAASHGAAGSDAEEKERVASLQNECKTLRIVVDALREKDEDSQVRRGGAKTCRAGAQPQPAGGGRNFGAGGHVTRVYVRRRFNCPRRSCSRLVSFTPVSFLIDLRQRYACPCVVRPHLAREGGNLTVLWYKHLGIW